MQNSKSPRGTPVAKDSSREDLLSKSKKIRLIFHNFLDASSILITEIGLFHIVKVLLFHPIKLINLFQVSFSYLFLKGEMWGIPPVLILEPTTFCQLRCPLCVIGREDFKRSNMHMDIGLIEKLLQECGKRLCVVILYIVGEPLLHPKITKIIKLFKEYDILVKISTNGNYKESMSKAIVQSGLDHIIFDIDGDNQEVYEKYRIGGSLNLLLSNIEKLAEAKKVLGSKKPFVEARLIVMKHNIKRVNLTNELLDNYNIDKFTIKRCLIRNEDEFPDTAAFIPDSLGRAGSAAPQSCYYLWTCFCVLVDGDVVPCCYDDKGEFILGNVGKESAAAILNNSKFIRFRQLVKNNPSAIPMCSKCDVDSNIYTT